MRAYTDDRVAPQQTPCFLHRHVVLAQMHAICLHQPGHVRAVVDDEQYAGSARPAADVSGSLKQLAFRQRLLAQLHDADAPLGRLGDRPVQGGGGGRCGEQRVQGGGGGGGGGGRGGGGGGVEGVDAIA